MGSAPRLAADGTMRLFGRRTAALEAQLEELRSGQSVQQQRIDELAREKGRLEGLLDVATDPDSRLPGAQNQNLYRQWVGGASAGDGDFSEPQRRQILRLSHMAYAMRGTAENLIEIHLDFMIGDGLEPRCEGTTPEAQQLQEQLDQLWTDPRNRLHERHEDLTRSLLLEGELVQRADLSEIDGHIETAYVDPLQVVEVVKDKNGRDVYLMVSAGPAMKPLRWFILDNLGPDIELTRDEGGRLLVSETSTSPSGVELVVRQALVDGLCFYWPWNRPDRATRGRGELGSVLDWVDAQDELLWSSVEIANLRRMILLHVKDASIKTPADGRQRLKDLGLLTPPRNPKSIATNEGISLEFVGGEQKGANARDEWLSRELGTGIMGAKGLPEAWRGSQGDENLAGARAADYVPLRRLRRKQKRLLRFWHRRLDVELQLRRRAGATIPELPFSLTSLEVGGKDRQRGTEVVKALSAALTSVASVQGVRPELVNQILVQALREAGFAVPKELEGLPPQLEDMAGEIEGRVRELMGQKSRTDDGSQDEGDRDRGGA